MCSKLLPYLDSKWHKITNYIYARKCGNVRCQITRNFRTVMAIERQKLRIAALKIDAFVLAEELQKCNI